MKDIVTDYLRDYTEQLLDLYTWAPDEKILLDRFGINVSSCDSELDKNVLLKNELTRIVQDNGTKANKIKIANYIIKDWGGIRRFNRAGEIVERFQGLEFTEHLPQEHFNFSVISSWSKYLSIIAPRWACIYDARVAYTLNVINYIYGSKHQIIPVPSGRNSKINLLNIETLLILEKLQDLGAISPKEIKRKCYIEEDKVYSYYINLIDDLHQILWEHDDPVQYTEMLLFAIADNYAYTDLLNFCVN